MDSSLAQLRHAGIAALAAFAAGLACADGSTAPVIASPATSLVFISPTLLPSGTEAALTLQARDADGTRITTGGLEVVFTVSGGTSQGVIVPIPATDNGNGTYAATFTATIAGSPSTIGATIDGQAITSTLPEVEVLPGPVSTATSQVIVSRRNVDEGDDATLTLLTRDAAGNALRQGGLNVSFTVSGGTSTGTVGPTTDHGDGTYSAIFSATTMGTPLTVAASIEGQPVTSPPPTIAVRAGALSLTMSEVTASADTVTRGTAITVTVITRDAQGNPLTGGGRTVVFLSSNDLVGTVDTTADHENGEYTTTFTAAGAGTATVTATVDGGDVTGGSPTIVVRDRPVSAQRSEVVASDETVAAGSTITVTLRARDDDSTALTQGGLTVLFTMSDSAAGVLEPTPATDHGDGTYSAIFSGRQALADVALGAIIVETNPDGSPDSTKVEMLDEAGVSHLPRVAVTPGPTSLDSSLVETSDALLRVGELATLTLTARDGFGNRAVTGGLSVTFTQSDGPGEAAGRITPTPATDNGDGTYTSEFVATRVGDPTTIGATVDGRVVTSTPLPTIAVLCGVGAVSVDSSLVTVSDAAIPSGVATTVVLRARDESGNCLRTTGLVVTFATPGNPGESTGAFGVTVDNGDGTYTATFTGVLVGTPASILGAIDGEMVASPAPTITVTPGDISANTSTVSASDTLVDPGIVTTLTLQARDAAGNDLVSGGRTVAFTQAGGTSAGVIGATTDHANGTYTAPFTATTVGTPTGLSATIDGTPLMTTPPTIEVSTVSTGNSVVTVDDQPQVTIAAGETVTLGLRARDPLDRDINGSGHAVVFTLSGGTSAGTIEPVIDQGNGNYTATLTAETAGSATAISATIDGVVVTTPAPTVTVIPGEASPATSVVSASDSVVTVGSAITLTLVARDAFGNALTAGGLEVIFAASSGVGVSTGAITPIPATDNGDGTYSATFTGETAGTPTTIGATIGGNAVTSALPSVRVTAAEP